MKLKQVRFHNTVKLPSGVEASFVDSNTQKVNIDVVDKLLVKLSDKAGKLQTTYSSLMNVVYMIEDEAVAAPAPAKLQAVKRSSSKDTGVSSPETK